MEGTVDSSEGMPLNRDPIASSEGLTMTTRLHKRSQIGCTVGKLNQSAGKALIMSGTTDPLSQ